MTIHHATAKKAAALKITLAEIEQHGSTHILATDKASDFSFSQQQPAKVVLDNARVWQMLAAEYPYLAIKIDGDKQFCISRNGEEIGRGETMQEAMDYAFEDYADETEEEAAATAKEDRSYSFTALARAKEAYRERGNVNHCGDWIAKELEGQFLVVDDGKEVFDYDKFADTLVANGVEFTGKWALLPESGSRGWQGRYRMNGRQRLEVCIAKSGVLILKGQKIKIPTNVLKELRQKHKIEG